MPILPILRNAWEAIFSASDLDNELDEELQTYLELLIDEKVKNGAKPAEARRQAMMELGGVEQVKARVRAHRHGALIDSMLQDVRFTIRTLRRAPGFTIVVVLTLAIGIGANTALFSTINALLLSSLPFEDPDRLVASTKTIEGRAGGPVSRLDYLDYRERTSSFEDLAALSSAMRISVTGGASAEMVEAAPVSWNLSQTLGINPIAGRFFTKEEEAQGGIDVIVVSHTLAVRRFGSVQKALENSISLNGQRFRVIGVMPPGFRFMFDADLWFLIAHDSFIDRTRDSHSLWPVGRLKPGISIAQAQSEVDALSATLEKQYPDSNTNKGLRLIDLQDYMVAHVRQSLNLLTITTGLVLLIACANVAGLLLARGQKRLTEMALRSAIGASRNRLLRQLMTESVILTLFAGFVGVFVAFLFQHVLLRLLPMGDPGVPLPEINGTVLLFSLGISVLAGLFVGIVPALRATSVNLRQHIESGSRATESQHSAHLRTFMVVVQIAVSVVLVIGCGLLIRSMVNLANSDLGFQPANIIVGTISINSVDYPTPEERAEFFTSLVDEVKTIPGVENSATISKLPIASPWTDWPVWTASQPRPSMNESRFAFARWVTPGYFETIGIPLFSGRDFTSGDNTDGNPVVVVSAAVAEGLFPGEKAIGRMIKLGWDDFGYEIVGIVGNARINSVRSDSEWAMYMSAVQMGPFQQWLVVRTVGDPFLAVGPIRDILHAKNTEVVFHEPKSMTAIINNDLADFQVVLKALGLLAGVALLLTAVGLYGVLTYHVSQRTHEFGIRLALGSSPTRLIRLILHKGLVMVGAGLIAGIIGAALATRLLTGLLYETAPFEAASYLGAVAFLVFVSLVACILPAWRAARVDPMTALRQE